MYVDRLNGTICSTYTAPQFQGQEFVANDAPELLVLQAKADKCAVIEAAYGGALGGGFAYNGATYPIDQSSQQCITSWGALALGAAANAPGLTWPQNFVWLDIKGNQQPFATAADFLAFAQAAATYVTALMLAHNALKVSTAAAQDLPTLAAIDPTTLTVR
jgi:hypothetical protein